jgi:small subunit ribosomal protein S8e
MALSHRRAKRTPSGARYIDSRKKKQYELGRNPVLTKVAERKVRFERTIGGNRKYKIFSDVVVNLADPKSGKIEKVKIKTVVENLANRHFVRRNILTKGAVVDTEKGKAKVTSRPGQEGTINAVLI